MRLILGIFLTTVAATWAAISIIDARLTIQSQSSEAGWLSGNLKSAITERDLLKDSFPHDVEIIKMEVTAYLCRDERESRYHGITASGQPCIPGVSAAVDPTVIPFGYMINVGRRWYIAHDTGSAIKGNRLDIAVATRTEAEQIGRKFMSVVMMK